MNNGKIFALIPKIMSEVGVIEKTRTNSQQGSGYKFRGIDDVYSALHPLLHKHGVFFTPSVQDSIREERTSKSGGTLIYTVLKVKYTFYADDGSTFDVIVPGEAMDSGDKSSNKAMSAALKYALLQVFCIPTEEEKDTEYHAHEVAPKSSGLVSSPRAASSGEYRVPFGKKFGPIEGNPGMTLQQIANEHGTQAISSYVDFLEKSAAKDNKPLSKMAQEFVSEAEFFLATWENQQGA